MADEKVQNLNVPYNVNELRQEGDFIIDAYKLIAYNGAEYDIQHLVAETVIYEDLFSNFISGHIALVESIDMPQLYPLIGQERIFLKFFRPNELSAPEDKSIPGEPLGPYELNARVIEISDRKRIGENKQQYVLYFVSEEYIKVIKKKVQKSYIDMRYSDMVADVFAENGLDTRKPLVAEPTRFLHDFVVPNYSPTEAINIFAGISISDEGNGSYYVFYEDKDQFNFVTIGKLLQNPVAIDLGHSVRNVFKNEGITIKPRDIEGDMVSSDFFSFHGGPNIAENLLGGMYASRLLTVDPLRKIYETYDFDYKAQWGTMPHIEKNDICTGDLDALGSPETISMMEFTNKEHDIKTWIAGKEPGILPFNIEEWLQIRLSQYQQLENHKLFIQIPGDPRRKVGEVVTFDMPSSVGDMEEGNPLQPDKYLSGKYLVTACKHILRARVYNTQLELIKDSFAGKIEHVDIKKKYAKVY